MEKQREAVEAVLGKPVAAQLVDEALKVRRNLLIASLVSFFSVLGNIQVDPASTVLGFKFTGLTPTMINVGLLSVTLYLLLHFGWYVWDSFVEWRLRLTGTRVAYLTGASFGSEHADYPADPKQSTLHNWWLQQSRGLQGIADMLVSVQKSMNDLAETVSADRASDAISGSTTLIQRIHSFSADLEAIHTSVKRVESIVQSDRIPVSLGRFDSWFRHFLKSQNMRWLFIDAGVPFLLGIFSVCGLMHELYISCRLD
ncbi:hypothetical protein K2O51_23405 [Cupriavidus pinatubonensis]|uniref:hypothetical protein n=1 Tax=Cupriavidus pinatubonensis TaxID=248026 RepID=UPI001C72D122|nr:hypothetical protein [Cupriavidus pinatubonensis]QYY30320.1 hypothetical protein K2O51_23405 [Cupriavidus pinatubonensis]